MSSDFFVSDNSFFSESLSLITESLVDPLPAEIQGSNQPIAIASDLIAFSSPSSVQLESPPLSQWRNADYSSSIGENEEFQFNFDDFSGLGILPNYFDESTVGLMQRSCSSYSLENKHNFSLRSRFDCVLEDRNVQTSPQGDSFSSGIHIRKICSTGDLQKAALTNLQSINLLQSQSPPLLDEAMIKVGRYTEEERKERIDRYRAKKTRRNFNKTIKYVCRKTLADNRQRVRGRFARNDQGGEIPKASSVFHRHEHEDEDDLWILATARSGSRDSWAGW